MPFPDIDPIALQLGPLPIRWYSLAYLSAALFGALYLLNLLKKPAYWGLKTRGPVNKEQLVDAATIAALGAILGGRMGYVFFYEPALLVAPWESIGSIMGAGGGLVKTLIGWIPIPPAVMMWKGGMSFHGGLIGVSVAGFLFARKNNIEPLVLGDLFACAAPIGLIFGRLANFVNGELYGRPSDVPWAMIFPAAPDNLPRHPSQLYEAALEGLVLFIVIFIASRRFGILQHKGAAIGFVLAGFGIARTFVENFRQPDAHLGTFAFGLTMGMILSIPIILLGLWMIRRAYTRPVTPIAEAPPEVDMKAKAK